jgi:hypothetical protein
MRRVSEPSIVVHAGHGLGDNRRFWAMRDTTLRSSRLEPHLAAGLLLVAAASTPGVASSAGDVHACVSIEGDAARLACYDSALGRVGAKAPSRATAPGVAPAAAASAAPNSAVAPASPPAAPPAVAQAADPAAEFGLTEAAKRAKNPTKQAELQSVTARVVSIRWLKYGEFVVTLDNGQVWEQIEPMPAAVIRIGDAVILKKALLGSYTLLTAGKVPTKVRRID